MFKYIFFIFFVCAVLSHSSDAIAGSSIIIPTGDVAKVLLENLGDALQEKFNMPFSIGEAMEIPEDAYNPTRRQYDSSIILDKLCRYKGEKILGVIDKDLYAEGLNFVFGQADLRGRCAIISITRLRQSFYGGPEDDKIFFDRVTKEAVHELGHTYGLAHCPDLKCVMFFSNSLMDTDRKSSSFCEIHLKKLK